MQLHIIIAPDKFKGSLSATDAATAIESGWKRARLLDKIEKIPITDGGDGFGQILANILGAQRIETETINAAHEPIRTHWWWHKESKTAIVESANIIGLAMLPAGVYHPFELDTFGLGLVLQQISNYAPEVCIVGLGGSSTNDGGFGLARALGWRFLDAEEKEIQRWPDLVNLKKLIRPSNKLTFKKRIVGVDVKNILLGKYGATRIFGPQKGLKPDELPLAEKCLRQLSTVVSAYIQKNLHKTAGTGAAGGLGFGLAAFLDFRIMHGFKIFSDLICLEKKLRAADLVITGEGMIDKSSMMGKAVGSISKLCKRHHIKCIALAGQAKDLETLTKHFEHIIPLVPKFTSLEKSLNSPAFWLSEAAESLARGYLSGYCSSAK